MLFFLNNIYTELGISPINSNSNVYVNISFAKYFISQNRFTSSKHCVMDHCWLYNDPIKAETGQHWPISTMFTWLSRNIIGLSTFTQICKYNRHRMSLNQF